VRLDGSDAACASAWNLTYYELGLSGAGQAS